MIDQRHVIPKRDLRRHVRQIDKSDLLGDLRVEMEVAIDAAQEGQLEGRGCGRFPILLPDNPGYAFNLVLS